MAEENTHNSHSDDCDTFISYRRDYGSAAAKLLYYKLRRSRLTVFMDTQEMERGLWEEQARKYIANSSVVVVILSREFYAPNGNHMTNDDSILKEIRHAIDNNKTILPVYLPGFDPNSYQNCDPDRLKSIEKFDEIKAALSKNAGCEGDDLAASIKEAVAKTLRLYPTRGLSYLEGVSAKAIANTRYVNRLLYDRGQQIERQFLDSAGIIYQITDIADFFTEHPMLFLSGEGGAGKTTFMQAMFDILREDSSINPIYLRAYDIKDTADREENADSLLVRYLSSLVNREINSDEEKISINAELEGMNTHHERPACVLMLDGLNEVSGDTQKNILSSLNEITKKYGRMYVVISARYSIPSLSPNYHHIRLYDLTREQIEGALGVDAGEIEDNMYRLLRFPLYLRLYKLAIAGDNHLAAIPGNSKYALLKYAFVDRPQIFEVVQENHAYAVYFRYVLPYLCYQLTNTDTLAVDRPRLSSLLKSYFETIKRLDPDLICAAYGDNMINEDNVEQMLKETDNKHRSILNLLIGTVFQEYTDASSDITFCQFCHQDIRDFFTAYYLKCTYNLIGMMGKPNDEAAELLCFNRDSFSSEAVDMLMGSGNLITDILPYNRNEAGFSWKVRAQTLDIFHFVTRDLIERKHNNSPEKVQVCQELRPAFKEAVDYICSNSESSSCLMSEEIDIGNRISILKIMRRYGEVLRRLDMYEESEKASDKLIRLCNKPEYSAVKGSAMNNKAKCKAYAAHSLAQNGEMDDSEIYKLYVEAMDCLQKNADENHSDESANLYALLLSYPDKISAPYVRRYITERKCSAKLTAFKYYCQSVSCNKSKYALQQCVSFVLHGDVVLNNYTEAQSPFDLFPTAVAAVTEGELPPENSVGYRYIVKVNDWLLDNTKFSMPYCFKGQLLLALGRQQEAISYFDQAYSLARVNGNPVVRRSVLACFIRLLIDMDYTERTVALTAIENTLESSINNHKIDGYDTLYICKEMISVYHSLDKAKLIDMELKRITEKTIKLIYGYTEEIK